MGHEVIPWLGMSDVKRIGVMMDLAQPFKRHVDVYRGIRRYGRQRPDWKLVVDEWAGDALPSKAGEDLPYDGIIGRIPELGATRARRLDLPAVNVWFSSPAKGLPGVFHDYAACGKLVTQHLLSRGFRYFAAIIQNGDKGTTLVANAMEACTREAGYDGWLGSLAVDESLTNVKWRRWLRTVEQWMDSWKLPLGLLVLDQTWAMAIIELARERGWQVPGQIGLVLAHNDDLLCEDPELGLTAVETAEEQRGYEAAAMLDELINRKRQGVSPFADLKTLLIPPSEVVTRHSTDYFAVDDPLVAQALRYITNHLHKPLEPAAVAKSVGVARRTLDAWFQRSIGVTVAAEISRLRIERVKRELLAGTDTIEQIARRTGFTSTRTLYDQFVASVGMSPRAFREQGLTKTGKHG
jgi:LacI family transcriptional regulator